MRLRVFTMVMLGTVFFAALWGASAYAQSQDTNLQIREFRMQPMNNATQITEEERALIGAWFNAGASTK